MGAHGFNGLDVIGVKGSLGQGLFDEGDAFGVDLCGGGEEVAPDAGGGGEVGEGSAEGFDGHPAVVTDFFEVLDLFGDVDVATARGATVVFGDVDMVEFAGSEDGVDGSEGVLLFDVGVEGVVHGAEVWTPAAPSSSASEG